MSFPGVVKPSPWPGLQANSSQYHHPARLWPHHHHGTAQAHSNDISEKISATSHFKFVPQTSRRSSPVPVKRARDTDSPTSNLTPSPFRQPPVFLFDDFLPRPAPVSTEPSPTPLPTPGGEGTVLRNGTATGEGEATALTPGPGPSPTLSPTSMARKKRVRRSRCGSCTGCMRKENCGTCCVCTNPNATNSVCKLKRCEILKRRVCQSFVLGPWVGAVL